MKARKLWYIPALLVLTFFLLLVPSRSSVQSRSRQNLLHDKRISGVGVLIRPPGTLVPKALCFTRDVFFLFFPPRDLRAPSADRRETFPHDRNMGALYNASPKIRGALPRRNWGPKTCKIRHDFRQLQTSIANISGTAQDIQNRKDIPPAFNGKSQVNFGPITTENCM